MGLPQPPRLIQHRRRLDGLPLAQEQLAASRQGACLEERTLEAEGDRLELLDRRPGGIEVTRRQGDLHMRWQEPRPVGKILGPAVAACRSERPAERAPGVVELAPRQLEQGQAGLGIVAVLVGSVELGRRAFEVAHPQADLADRVVREPQAVEQAEALELLARLASLLLGPRPVAAEHLQLGPMDLADAREATGAVALHPALALVRPLARALQVADVPAAPDRHAEDVARHAEVQLPARGRCGALVDVLHPARHIAHHQLGDPAERGRHVELVRGVVAARDLDRLVRKLDAVIESARVDRGLRRVDEGPGVQPVLGLVREETLGTSRPAAARRAREPAVRLVGEAHRGPGRIDIPALLRVLVERALEDGGGVIRLGQPPRGGAEQLQVLAGEVAVAVGLGECGDCSRPVMASCRVPAGLQGLDHGARIVRRTSSRPSGCQIADSPRAVDCRERAPCPNASCNACQPSTSIARPPLTAGSAR